MRITNDRGKVQHAESAVIAGAGMHIFLYVEDADASFAQAIDAGAKELEAVKVHSEGDRRGGVIDPFGHIW